MTKSPEQKNTDKNAGKEKPPVIVIMGHVDHGKSTLLDYIRKTNTTEKESGGITQHMAAYEVEHQTSEGKKNKITFLDTPGHEAFSAIRSRGAEVADIAVLVVSAEDGVMPQTLEALNFIRESKLPLIVAINKIDKPGANIDKAKQSLAENEVLVEGYGGDTPVVPISAKTGEGIPELLDMMLLVAEMEELKGSESEMGEGFVLESHLDHQKGITATLVIQNGTLESGMCVVSGESLAPVRIMEDFKGDQLKKAGFSSPVKIIGWDKPVEVGKPFHSFKNKKEALTFIEKNKGKGESEKIEKVKETGDDKTTVPIIIKADSAGSIDAIKQEIEKLDSDRVDIKITHSGIGNITEGDIKTAGGNKNPIVAGFHVKADNTAKNLAERLEIKIETFEIIYELTEWLKEEIQKRTPKISVEEVTGKAKIIRVFSKTKNKQVVGGKVKEGVLMVGENVRIKRREEIIGSGKILELQTQKVKAEEVKEGSEFGSMIESKMEIAAGDEVEAFKVVEK